MAMSAPIGSRSPRSAGTRPRRAAPGHHPRLDRLGRPKHGRPAAAQPRRLHGRGADRQPQRRTLLAEQARALRRALRRGRRPGRLPGLKERSPAPASRRRAAARRCVEAAERPADWVMAGIVGAAGLAPTLAAVAAAPSSPSPTRRCWSAPAPCSCRRSRAHGATLLPVDSEHNAIWQCFDFDRADGDREDHPDRSGGPFRERSRRGDARRHAGAGGARTRTGAWAPRSRSNSATMMNKGLELIEAHHLFQLPPEQIEVVVHPQSIVHGLVDLPRRLGAGAARLARHAHADRLRAGLAGPHRGADAAARPRGDRPAHLRGARTRTASRRCGWPARRCGTAAAARPC